jgi:hypothetical protein
MKTKLLRLFGMAMFLGGIGQSQELLQNRHGIGHGKSYRQPSENYVARVPYVLEWTAKSTYNLYRNDPTVKYKVEDTSVQVFDADSGRMVADSKTFGLKGSIRVPVGGKHYVIVYSLGEWDANFIEDAEILKQAERYGLLTKDSIITQAMIDAKAAENNKRIESAALKGISPASKIPVTAPVAKPSSDPDLPPGMERARKGIARTSKTPVLVPVAKPSSDLDLPPGMERARKAVDRIPEK